MQQTEKWADADAYAEAVAARITEDLLAAGVHPCDVGGEPMEDALVRRDRPLTVRHIALAARRLNADPSAWMRR